MDKETLSNYGWIVIAVLVLVVMIALATPFGNFIATAVKSTTAGFFNVGKNALNNTGLIVIEDQEFDVPGSDETVSVYYGDIDMDGDVLIFAEIPLRRIFQRDFILNKPMAKMDIPTTFC